MLLSTLIDDLYVPLRGIQPSSVRIYKFTLRSWGKYLGHEPTLDDLEELTVARFLAHRLATRKIATAAKDRTQIRALWEFAARRKLIDRWPQIRPIRVPERVPVCWLTDELRRLLTAASEREGTIAGIPAGLWWKALLLLAYEVGERCSAILSLRWEDVGPGGVVFRAESRKGSRRDIHRPISPECLAALEAIRTDRDIVFVWDRHPGRLWSTLGVICKAAGLPNDRGSKFHRLRKTHASYACAAGLDAQRLLDHASPLTTRKYLDPRVVAGQSAAAVLPKVS
jgi:integrase